MVVVRPAQASDVAAIREIFIEVYGDDYPHHEVYDERHLTRAVFDEQTLLLVAEDTPTSRVVGTAAVLLDIGAHGDLVGEFGRLAVRAEYRHLHIGDLLMQHRLDAVRDRLHVGLVVARTVHPYAQRISAAHGFIATGFLPGKHLFRQRESFALLAHYFGDALALRRNNPHVIPEAAGLAGLVLNQAGLPDDLIIDDGSAAYPTGGAFELETLQADGYPALLRIERGRVRHREIFGPVRLDYGFFAIATRQTTYLLARAQGRTVGAVGLSVDATERSGRVFELIASSDDVSRFLLEAMSRHCERAELEYVEVDVSAYAPRMQRTLLELGFRPVAYVPAMAFHEVERLDIVKMARLASVPDIGLLALTPAGRTVAEVVIQGFSSALVAPRMAEAIAEVALFSGMTAEQASRLAAIGRVSRVAAGGTVFTEGQPSDAIYLVLSGTVSIVAGSESTPLGTVNRGDALGEVSLLADRPHSATATVTADAELAMLPGPEVQALIRRRPDIGVIIYRNLARGLGDKLLRSDDSLRDHEGRAVRRGLA